MSAKLVSVVIPVYNEEKVLEHCLNSLKLQSYKPVEIIVVDDGSTDNTPQIAKTFNVKFSSQNHKGPGPARNLGATKANGEILVFVDSDMTFEKNFIKDLTKPILNGKTIGTFSKNEMNANKNNVWSRCWNINRNWPLERLIPPDYPNTAPVFRAILKEEFNRVGGFDATGEYTDDWSLSRKLKKNSTLAKGAIYFHSNPGSLKEIYKQARWIGKNEFISGSVLRRIRSFVKYSLVLSIMIGVSKSLFFTTPQFLIFKIIYDFAITTSTVKSFFKEPKYK